MRRTTTVPLVAAIALPLTAVPAHADSGFWHSVGLPGVDAFGVYNAGRSKVRLSADLRDTRKDGYSPAVHLTFTEKGHPADDRLLALRGDATQSEWHTVTSSNTGHLYVQECLGSWTGKRFTTSRCGGWRRHY